MIFLKMIDGQGYVDEMLRFSKNSVRYVSKIKYNAQRGSFWSEFGVFMSKIRRNLVH